jgi:hypothetical protein
MDEFIDRFRPATNCIAYYKSALADVSAACEDWLRSQCRLVVSCYDDDIDIALSRMFPMSNLRNLFVQCNNGWTAHFIDGDDRPKVRPIIERLRCRTAVAGYVSDTYDTATDRGTLGGVQLALYEAGTTDFFGDVRSIGVVNEWDRWMFDQSNTAPWWFEKIDMYKARRIRDRFTLHMLEEYLRAMDIHAYFKSFYLPSSVLIEPKRDADGYWGHRVHLSGSPRAGSEAER